MKPLHRTRGPFRSRPGWLAIAAGLGLAGLTGPAAELQLDFGRFSPGPPPAEFKSALTGEGPPPDWRVVQVEVDSQFAPLTDRAPAQARETVLGQLSENPADERFPLLVYEPEEFGDFTATLEFRTVQGRVERMAGLAFRLQNETNYYVVRASSLGRTFRFYKFVNGQRSDPIGPEIPIPSGEWHTLEVNCQGNTIRCRLNGRDAIPALTDSSFTRGRLALWTKSDSVSHFRSLRVTYDPLKTLPQRLVERGMKEFPRLLGLTVYAREGGQVRAVASSEASLVGTAGGGPEDEVLASGTIQAGTRRDSASAVFPLRDRNGDPRYAVRLKMRTFAGQTDANAAARGRIIADYLEGLVQSAEADGK